MTPLSRRFFGPVLRLLIGIKKIGMRREAFLAKEIVVEIVSWWRATQTVWGRGKLVFLEIGPVMGQVFWNYDCNISC